MQDIQSIGGRFFGGTAGGGDRRLRPHHGPNHQALKCPRCDSLNTKFCYYNNYNLSQPRHFCKSCRRYWTKGGVLRNVPVGGGCRKAKRSKPKSSPSPGSPPQPDTERKASSNSSSESSSLTATNTAATTATEAVSAPSTSTSSASNLLNLHPDSRFFPAQSGVSGNFETNTASLLEPSAENMGMFSDIGSFTNLITASNDVPFGFSNINDVPVSPFRLNQAQGGQHHHHNQVQQSQWLQQNQSQEPKMQEITAGMLDQTVPGGGGGFGSLDWQAGEDHDQSLFDLPNSVDQSYWSHGQWTTDQDPPTLFLP